MIRIPEIRREIEKFLKKDYLKAELKKMKSELKTMDIYKKIPEPTLKHISQLEDQFGQWSEKIGKTQKQMDIEFNNAMKMLEKRKKEASDKIVGLRDYAFEQKEVIEERIREQIQAFSGQPVKKVRKKVQKKKATKKKAQKVTAKSKAKKKVTKAKKKKAAKKTSTRKKS